jgi:hypothetical protein
MKKTLRLTERELTNLIKKIVKEEDEFDMKKTVMDTAGFQEAEIPSECLENPEIPEIETIQACINKITEKSTGLNNALKALTERLNSAKSESSSIKTESRRRYRRF